MTQTDDAHEHEPARALLDSLLTESKLYTQSREYKELLEFVIRLRNFAPFNGMLLQLQKPGLSYAASAHDWANRFSRFPKRGARPLLILWPFGPVALVYDVMDTEGQALPRDVEAFFAVGEMDEATFAMFPNWLSRKRIAITWVDAGDNKAGSIRAMRRIIDGKEVLAYDLCLNRNHSRQIQFCTMAHELAHLFLGHLGPNPKLNVPRRVPLSHEQREIEAESVAYLVCKRNGISPASQTYLADLVAKEQEIDELDLYQIMRAAGQVETALGRGGKTSWGTPSGAV